MEKESISKERNNDGEKNQFLKSFDDIFKNYFKILDFNELDANRFLSIKDSKMMLGRGMAHKIMVL